MLRVLCLALGFLVFASFSWGQNPKLRDVIDKEMRTAWKAEAIEPVAPADDSVFLRRVFLDLVGMIPTEAEALAFLENKSPTKRAEQIEQLLADPRFAVQQAAYWDLLMFGRHPGEEFRRRDSFKTWLTDTIQTNKGFDALVKQLLLAEQEGSEAFLARFRNRPEDATVEISRIFLGTQVQCARCHDHPFDKWLQKDFYGMTGFFVRLVVNESGPADKRKFTISEKASGDVLFSGNAKDQAPGKKGEPVKPRFLGMKADLDEPPLPKDFKEPVRPTGPLPKPPFSRKEKFAEWATAPANPFFAKAIVNRVWSQFLGRGLAHPVDDMGEHNAPSHPALLEALATGFVASKFDLKGLIRELVNSEVYQLGASGGGSEALPKFFERARVRPLSAEELLTSLKIAGGLKPSDKPQNVTTEYFLRYFGEPTNGQGYFQGGLGEHLFLNNSGDVRVLLSRRKGNLADEVILSKDPWEKRVEKLFLTVLTRRPTATETERFVRHLTDPKGKVEALVEEAIWVLANTAEFRFNK